MATPSLAMIPSGYKASKVYSVLPESGVGDFDFTRATTATRVNSSGLIEEMAINVPRLEYPLIDGVVNGCPSLLLEPQSLNQIINSENLSNSSWGKTNAVVESNSTISPNGTLTADKLTFNTSGNFGRIVSSNLTFINSVSFFIKYIDLEYILIFLGTSSNGVYVNIKEGYATSTVIGAGLDITFKKYPNDWLRIEASGGNNGTSLEIYAANSIPNYSPITLNGSFYLWGLQAETNSYPTSYIPTNGSTVTRNAETCTGAGDAATFNDSEGVLMAEISALSDDTTSKTISLTNGSQSNGIELFYFAGNSIYINLWSGGVSQGFLNYEIDIQNFNKVSYSYKLNDTALWINGFKVDTDTSASMPIGLSELAFENGVNANYWYGKAKQVQYYNSALTDSELEQLTSWTSFSDMANGQQYTII
jgi:hypothetical protein